MDMIERMAKAFKDGQQKALNECNNWTCTDDHVEAGIVAALSALEEPSEAMVEAGNGYLGGGQEDRRLDVYETFSVMIQAAMGEDA